MSIEIKNEKITLEIGAKQGLAGPPGSTQFSGLTDKETADLPAINTPLAQALAAKVTAASIVDNLTSTAANVPLSANQGRVLAGLIDAINTLLTSDDTSLDEVQEIVNYIKLNRSDLDSLSISSVAGLQAVLDQLAIDIANAGGAVAAEDITDAGTVGVAVVQAETAAEIIAAAELDDGTNTLSLSGLEAVNFYHTLGTQYLQFHGLGLRIFSNAIPSSNGSYDLGSADKEWRDIHASGTVKGDEVQSNGAKLTSSSGAFPRLELQGGSHVGGVAQDAEGYGLCLFTNVNAAWVTDTDSSVAAYVREVFGLSATNLRVMSGGSIAFSGASSNKQAVASPRTCIWEVSEGVLAIGGAAQNSATGTLKLNAISLASGSVNAATLSSGTITVANTSITADSHILLTRKAAGGTIGDLTYTISAGVGFTINSASVSDTSEITYLIIEQAS